MTRFGPNKNTFFNHGPYFEHSANKEHAKYGSVNSTSSEKGTDNKKNNTSEYNHDYYMKNKNKWAGNSKEWSKDDKDFDESNYSDENWLKDTDFYIKKKDDGSYVVLLEDTKWTIPKGANIEEIKKNLQEAAKSDDVKKRSAAFKDILSGGKSGEKEFDVDAAARDVIRGKYKNGAERKAALGEDYDLVQKRVNELMKKQKKSTNENTTNSSETTKKDTGKLRTISEAWDDKKKEDLEKKKKKYGGK